MLERAFTAMQRVKIETNKEIFLCFHRERWWSLLMSSWTMKTLCWKAHQKTRVHYTLSYS